MNINSEPVNSNLIKNIKTLLEINSLSIRALSEKSNISYTTLNHVINGKTQNPGIDVLIKLCNFFDVSADELLFESKNSANVSSIAINFRESDDVFFLSNCNEVSSETSFALVSDSRTNPPYPINTTLIFDRAIVPDVTNILLLEDIDTKEEKFFMLGKNSYIDLKSTSIEYDKNQFKLIATLVCAFFQR